MQRQALEVMLVVLQQWTFITYSIIWHYRCVDSLLTLTRFPLPFQLASPQVFSLQSESWRSGIYSQTWDSLRDCRQHSGNTVPKMFVGNQMTRALGFQSQWHWTGSPGSLFHFLSLHRLSLLNNMSQIVLGQQWTRGDLCKVRVVDHLQFQMHLV